MFLRRISIALLALLVFAAPAFGTTVEKASKPEVAVGYGAKLSGAKVVAVSTLMTSPEKYVGKKVKVEGRVLAVCKMRGCWMDIAGDEDFESIRIKVNDGDIVFPVEAKGKMATAEGTFEKIELTLEQTQQMKKHECEKKGEKFEPESCTQPGVLYRIAGLGAVIQ